MQCKFEVCSVDKWPVVQAHIDKLQKKSESKKIEA